MEWKKRLAMMTERPSSILSQHMWCNESIQVDKATVNFLEFFEESINYVLRIFSDNGSIKKWHQFNRECNLHETSYFQIATIIGIYS